MAATTVLVSGANGYIAQTLIYQLLQKEYIVIGQVRTAEKGEALTKIVNSSHFSYVVVPVIESQGAFDKVLKEHPQIEIFFHTASPVNFSNDNVEQKTLLPAINGTRYVLESVERNAPQLKHFVYTSSAIAQLQYGHYSDPVNEDSWSPITYEDAKKDGHSGYAGSKKFAEQEIWKYREAHHPAFSITTVLPSLVFGPQAYEESVFHLTSSVADFAHALRAKSREEVDSILSFQYGVDVRDVARVHIFAAEHPDVSDGHRFSLSNGSFNADFILTIFNQKYPEKCTVKPKNPPVAVPFDFIDSKRTQEIVGEFMPLSKSIEDTIDQLVKVGYL